jgi:hypothetical protein
VNPIEMSKEVLAAISHTYELASYSTPELRSLFDDWLGEIERLVGQYINDRRKADPQEIASRFKLRQDSVIFIMSKLAREGKITMQATATSSKIKLLKGEK